MAVLEDAVAWSEKISLHLKTSYRVVLPSHDSYMRI